MNSAAEWYAEQEYRERCGMPHEGESMPKQKMTNGDRIRSMTDEELADVMQGQCPYCAYQLAVCAAEECKDGVYEWLKQEVYEYEQKK